MCGVVGIVSSQPVQRDIIDALTVLQHRGQDSAGLAILDGNKMNWRKGIGLVRDVFRQHHIDQLTGNVGIGHVRYPTSGGMKQEEAQPMYVSMPLGICLGHNGNLVNAARLSVHLQRECMRDISTGSDSEILLNVLAHHLQLELQKGDGVQASFAAVAQVMQHCRGAFSVVAVIKQLGLLAFRDPMGIRPLCIGARRESSGEIAYMVASESAALQALDFELIRDIAPGEAVLISSDENGKSREPIYFQCVPGACRPCIFEWVYLARPDSILDGASVYKARLNMGNQLATRVAARIPDLKDKVDAIIPVPECSTTCAAQMASDLRLPYREAFVKNRYIGRTFIMPLQEQRRRSVRQKLNPLEAEFRGKSVLLVDDSIVRGTTCAELIAQARKMGARKVYFASAAPPIRHANVFGIDMPSCHELVAHGRSEKEIAQYIGTEDLIYQSLEGLEQAVRDAAGNGLEHFETSIFTGEYPLGEVNHSYLQELEARRNDMARQRSLLTDMEWSTVPQETLGVF